MYWQSPKEISYKKVENRGDGAKIKYLPVSLTCHGLPMQPWVDKEYDVPDG